MKRNAYFLLWWLIFSLIMAGSTAAWFLGLFHMTNVADVTKLSFLIYLLFLVFTVRCGFHTYQFSKSKETTKAYIDLCDGRTELSWFVSDICLTLGMLGTILGYIYMIEVGFKNLDPGQISSMHIALKQMALGWGTALYTTASGLICGLLLKLQLFNITRLLRSICISSEECSSTSNLPLDGLGA